MCLPLRQGLVLSLRPARVASCPTRLFSSTTALVTPPCLVFKAWPPVSLSLVSPGPSPPSSGACPHLRPLRRGAAARCPSLLRGHERYFLLVVDDYLRYTTVFPLCSKGEVTEVLIDWIRAARLRLRESFGSDFPVLRLHSDRGGEFSSALLGAFCRAQGIRQTFTLPASPQQNGIAERRIGMVMDVARFPTCTQHSVSSFIPVSSQSLRQPVYGLRQVPREWHDTLRTTLAALGFAPLTAEPKLFLRTYTSLSSFYVLVCVDDLVFATADTEALALVKAELQERHTCTDLGELRSYLGLQITRDRARRTITLTQTHMVQQVLQRFDFTWSSPQPTPLGHSLSAPPSDESVEPSGPYPELVGCLMYLMTCTRPDLAYPLSLLARYVAPGRHRKL
ncbi:unnamed protein product [Closterium sp. NIES-53]